jgi:predicted GIY-YIG superfamily endonuclease
MAARAEHETTTPPDSVHWYVYMVRCADGSIYTGIAKNVGARIRQHNLGRGAVYTSSRRPVQIIYQEVCPDLGSALRREHQIKRMKRKTKEELAQAIGAISPGPDQP